MDWLRRRCSQARVRMLDFWGVEGGAQGLYWEAMRFHGRQSTGSNLAGAQDWKCLRLWAPQMLG